MNKIKAESIIFDMDGTLWDSADNVAMSWNEAIHLSGIPALRDMKLTGDDIRGIMGLTMTAIAEKFFPSLSETRRMELLESCAGRENDYLAANGGVLFDDVEETLKKLSEGHRLFIVSNCQSGYIEAFFEYYGITHYFTDYLCWGDTGKEKNVTIKLLMEKNNVKSACYVGDTAGDMNSSEKAGIPFVYAGYGFGKLPDGKAPSAKIGSFAELTEVIE